MHHMVNEMCLSYITVQTILQFCYSNIIKMKLSFKEVIYQQGITEVKKSLLSVEYN